MSKIYGNTVGGGVVNVELITETVEQALAEAKENGDFNGADGTDGKDGQSVTVSSIIESTEDSGKNIITFSDGKTVTITNGSKGSQGTQGEQGAKGAKGDKGDKGDKGATGAAGNDGVSVTKTEINNKGELVITLSDNTVSNLGVVVGAKGDKGDKGDQGDKGEQGADGTNGMSAYQLWLAEGNEGSEADFLESLRGKDGADGTSVTITETAHSSDDGGTNSVYFSNGSVLNVKNGSKGSNGADGATGQRGTGLLPITTAPSSYTTTVHGIEPKYRIALSTVKTQSGATEVLLGDTLRYNYYHYPIAYVDASYVYCATRISIRGAQGKQGIQGDKGEAGADGANGLSAYDIWLQQNNTGSEEDFLTSLKGEQGEPGEKGEAGVNGTSVSIQEINQVTLDGGTSVVKFTDGNTLTIKNGSKGADGYTPIRGTDYWTENDKVDIIEEVKAEVPLVKTAERPIFVNSVDEMTDTSKVYVMPDGYLYAYMTKEVVVEAEDLFQNSGYQLNYRHSSSGVSAQTGAVCSGFISIADAQANDYKLRIKGLPIANLAYATGNGYNRIAYYKTNGQLDTGRVFHFAYPIGSVYLPVELDGDDVLVTLNQQVNGNPIDLSDISQMKVSLYIGESTITDADVADIRMSFGEGSVTKQVDVTDGFEDDTILSVSTGNTSSLSGFVTTPFIDFSKYPIDAEIRLSGIDWAAEANNTTGYSVVLYDENKTMVLPFYLYLGERGEETVNMKYIANSATDVIFKAYNTSAELGFKYVRFCGNGTAANAVVQIIYTEKGVTTQTDWMNTGNAFVPADYEDRILGLEQRNTQLIKEVTEHEARLDMLENNAEDAGIPDYWIDELETKADTIQQAMESAGRNKSAFLWYTDAHCTAGNSKVSPMLLNYLYKNTPMNKVNFGGDVIGDPATLTHNDVLSAYEWRAMIKGLPNHHSVIGNHDNLHKGRNDSNVSNIVYSFLIAPEESTDMVMGDDFYYYIDNPCEKTRYLYLDSGRFSLDDDETKFIIDSLTSVSEGWHIVVISHIWFQYNSASTPTVGNINTYMQKALDLFDAYNARQSGSVTMVSIAHSYDFSNCGGKVEFCIGGHIHVDHEVYSANGIPVILTASDTNQERSSDETEDSGTIGTITESAVFGIIADYNSNKITVVGVGRGTSREISY